VHAAEKLAGEAEVTMLQTREFREGQNRFSAVMAQLVLGGPDGFFTHEYFLLVE